MIRRALALWMVAWILLAPMSAAAQISGGSTGGGSSSTTNVSAGPTTLDAAEEAESVAVEGRQGIHVSFPSSDLDGTLVPECSPDGETNWETAAFMGMDGDVDLSFGGDGSNAAGSFDILFGGGVTHCRVRLSARNSGSIDVTLTATTVRPWTVVAGTDGTTPRVPKVTNTTPDSADYAWVVRFVGNTATGTSMTDDAGVTVGTTAFTPIGGTYKSTLDSVDDNDGGIFAMTQQRALYTSCLTPAGDSCIDDTFDAIKAVLEASPTIAGKSADATSTNYLNCTSSFNMSTTTQGSKTYKLVDAPSGERIHVCGMIVYNNSSTAVNSVSIVRGTGSNCGTGTTTVAGPFKFDGSKGFLSAPAIISFFDSGAEDNDLCLSYNTSVVAYGKYMTTPD